MQRLIRLKDGVRDSVSGAFASATGRKQAERRRKRVAAASAAGAATAAAGTAGVLLSKKRGRDKEAAREAAYQVPQPAPGATPTNGSAAQTVPSGSEPPA